MPRKKNGEGKTPPETAAAGGHGPTETTRGGARRLTDADLYPSPEVWAIMKEQAKLLLESQMNPEKLDTEAKILIVMQRGRELGIPPIQACSSIFVNDDGLPSMTAELMRSRVAASGVGKIVVDEYTDEIARVRGIRYGQGDREDDATPFQFSKADAERAGNQFSKGLPRHTLIARATSDCARIMFSDVLAGVVYTPEDFDVGEGRKTPLPPKQAATPPGVAQEGVKAPATAPKGQGELPTPTPSAAKAVSGAPTHSAPAAEAAPVGGQPEGGGQAAAPSPPPSGTIPDSGVPGRPWVGMQHVPTGDGGELVPVWTHGITAEQLVALGGLTRQGGPALIAKGQAWYLERGAKTLRHLSKAEGVEILAYLTAYLQEENGKKQPGPAESDARMTWEQARAQLDVVAQRYQLGPLLPSILTWAAEKHQVPSIEAVPAEALYAFVRDLEEQGQVDNGAALRIALERARTEAGTGS